MPDVQARACQPNAYAPFTPTPKPRRRSLMRPGDIGPAPEFGARAVVYILIIFGVAILALLALDAALPRR